eukprot:scaffold294607_cov30-Tisochrysis_lutea.AAC.1
MGHANSSATRSLGWMVGRTNGSSLGPTSARVQHGGRVLSALADVRAVVRTQLRKAPTGHLSRGGGLFGAYRRAGQSRSGQPPTVSLRHQLHSLRFRLRQAGPRPPHQP